MKWTKLLFCLFFYSILIQARGQDITIVRGVYNDIKYVGLETTSAHIEHLFVTESGETEVLVQHLYPKYKRRNNRKIKKWIDTGFFIHKDHQVGIGTIHLIKGKRYCIALSKINRMSLMEESSLFYYSNVIERDGSIYQVLNIEECTESL